MKITCSKKEDVLRRKAEYEAQKAKYDEAVGQVDQTWRRDNQAVYTPIKQDLERRLSQFNLLHFMVNVGGGIWGGLEVRILCDENEKFSDNSALSWSYNVSLNEDGELRKESSSWSGLKAVTAEQVASLKQSVAAIEVLLNIDWVELLSVKLPEYSDYYTEELYNMQPDRPSKSWETQLSEAELSDAIGTNIWFKCRIRDTDNRRWYDYWVNPIKETPMRYAVNCVSAGWNETDEEVIARISSGYKWTQTVSKVNLSLDDPMRTVEV